MKNISAFSDYPSGNLLQAGFGDAQAHRAATARPWPKDAPLSTVLLDLRRSRRVEEVVWLVLIAAAGGLVAFSFWF